MTLGKNSPSRATGQLGCFEIKETLPHTEKLGVVGCPQGASVRGQSVPGL